MECVFILNLNKLFGLTWFLNLILIKNKLKLIQTRIWKKKCKNEINVKLNKYFFSVLCAFQTVVSCDENKESAKMHSQWVSKTESSSVETCRENEDLPDSEIKHLKPVNTNYKVHIYTEIHSNVVNQR